MAFELKRAFGPFASAALIALLAATAEAKAPPAKGTSQKERSGSTATAPKAKAVQSSKGKADRTGRVASTAERRRTAAKGPKAKGTPERRVVAASQEEASEPAREPNVVPLSPELELLRQAVQAFRKGDVAEGDPLRAKLTDPAALALVDWLAIRSGVPLPFERIRSFQETNPDWPISATIRRRSEEALLSARKPASFVRAFFENQQPTTGAGRLALALALHSEGQDAQATALARQAWREDSFGRETEARILDNFGEAITQEDHRFRMERFLFKQSWASAQRAAAYAGKDYVFLAKARMAARTAGRKAEEALAAVPADLRDDSSFRFSRALFLRRANKPVEAAAAIAGVTRDPAVLVDGDEWWLERRAIARELMDQGNFKAAYEVSSEHGAEGNAQRIEAEFHAGWIALRFLNDVTAAEKHFAAAGEIAETPISVARAAYWQGRAAEAAGSAEAARRHFERAAEYPIAYYGQLARRALGLPLVEVREPEVTGESRVAFRQMRAVEALRLLNTLGEEDLAVILYSDLAQKLGDAAQLHALGVLAADQNNPRATLVVGKTAIQRGLPLDRHAYPDFGVPAFKPAGEEVEKAMVYAITRQESAFNPAAKSHAGARGLMQLMPATAKRTAARFGVSFEVNRLTQDPSYNAKIGAAHLGELMEDWRGSHILAFASYNAGGGNVSKWIKSYGDPRSPQVDPIDWVERIPFYETRNYVQRVLENLHVYRERLDNEKPPQTESANADLP